MHSGERSDTRYCASLGAEFAMTVFSDRRSVDGTSLIRLNCSTRDHKWSVYTSLIIIFQSFFVAELLIEHSMQQTHAYHICTHDIHLHASGYTTGACSGLFVLRRVSIMSVVVFLWGTCNLLWWWAKRYVNQLYLSFDVQYVCMFLCRYVHDGSFDACPKKVCYTKLCLPE